MDKAIFPSNVPLDRIVDFDVHRPAGIENGFHEAWLALHKSNPAPLLWTSCNGGHWIVNDSSLVASFYADFEHFSSDLTQIPRERGVGNNAIPASLDPPEQTPYRRLINAALSPRVVREMERDITEKAVGLVSALQGQNGCEFVGEFALRLPLELFMDYAALPHSDIPQLRHLAEQKMRPTGAITAGEAQEALASYLDPFLRERRGGSGDDLLSRIVNGEVSGRPVTHDEARRICGQFLVAGLDTVAAMLSFIFLYLARHPDLRRRLAEDDALLIPAVEEFLRRFPLMTRVRRVTKDYECSGVTLLKDDAIVLPTALHGLDERLFAEPEAVLLNRKPQVTSTFGHGPHQCPGATLARMELRIALREWLARIPDFRVSDESAIEFKPGFVASMGNLPLAWN